MKICIPYYDSLPQQMIEFRDVLLNGGIPGYQIMVDTQEGALIHFLRNEFVTDTPQLQWDFLFFLDDDMGFQKEEFRSNTVVDFEGKKLALPYMLELMKRILDHNLNICGGLYCQRGAPYLPQVFKLAIPDRQEGPWINILNPPDEGVLEVDAIGTGFLCIKRQVFDAFSAEHERRLIIKRNYENFLKDNPEVLRGLSEELKKYLEIAKPQINPPFWFDHVYDPTRGTWGDVGEDIYFCREAQKLGFKIYCDFSVQLGHMTLSYRTPAQYKYAFMKDQLMQHKAWCDKNNFTSPVLDFASDLREDEDEVAEEAESTVADKETVNG
ncbi:MAG: hypothetical protein AB1690_02450 [Candidatus Zixiibacteriota bacterium]